MNQVDPNSTRRKGLWATLAIAAVSGASAVTIALPAISNADPEPPPVSPGAPAPGAPAPGAPAPGAPAPGAPAPGAPAPGAPAPGAPAPGAPAPGEPGVPPPGPGDPVPPLDPNAGRIDNPVGGFSFVLPPGWVESDASHLDYGSALLSKTTGQPPMPGQPPPVANDTRIVLGRLDQKLYASAEATNPKAAVRLGSDMGEFFMPYAGTRVNQEAAPLNASGAAGSASYYEVKFADPSKPNGQIWTGVVGSPAANAGPPQRWFVVWLGTANDPVDKGLAKALAESIRPLGAPAPPPGAPAPAPAPGAPAPAPAPGAPAPAPAPGAPAPAPAPGAPAPAPAPGAPAPAPAPGEPPMPAPGAPAGAPGSPPQAPASAPAGEVTPIPTPTPRTQIA
jgi:Fibronectin-attachment protein (FAP)